MDTKIVADEAKTECKKTIWEVASVGPAGDVTIKVVYAETRDMAIVKANVSAEATDILVRPFRG